MKEDRKGQRGPKTIAGKRRVSRNATRHGAYTLVAAMNGRRTIDARLSRILKQEQDCLARDLGGGSWADLSRQRQILVRRVVFKRLICESIEAYVVERGAIKEDGVLLESLDKNYLAFTNSLRLDLMALGLARQTRDVTPTLDEIRKRYEGSEGEP